MILDLIFSIIYGLFISILVVITAPLSLLLKNVNFTDLLNLVFQPITFFNGILPMSTLLSALIILLVFYNIRLGFSIFRFIVRFIPFINS